MVLSSWGKESRKECSSLFCCAQELARRDWVFRAKERGRLFRVIFLQKEHFPQALQPSGKPLVGAALPGTAGDLVGPGLALKRRQIVPPQAVGHHGRPTEAGAWGAGTPGPSRGSAVGLWGSRAPWG